MPATSIKPIVAVAEMPPNTVRLVRPMTLAASSRLALSEIIAGNDGRNHRV
jgi:hypothetical protein